MSQRILVVDDEPDLLELVRFDLTAAGFRVDVAGSGTAALAALSRARPHLLILDLMLPDIEGTELCRRVRATPELADLPIIMLTAKAGEVDRIVGLELGADDYLTKPFSPRELALRVRAVLRRKSASPPAEMPLEHGGVRLEPETFGCWVGERAVVLTAKEFGLMRALMQRPGRVMTRDRLLADVWGHDVTVTSRTIDTHLKRLREKLGDAGALIETVRGVGYRFAA
jgi:two-component system phosphate regulon response regulator PhoB